MRVSYTLLLICALEASFWLAVSAGPQVAEKSADLRAELSSRWSQRVTTQPEVSEQSLPSVPDRIDPPPKTPPDTACATSSTGTKPIKAHSSQVDGSCVNMETAAADGSPEQRPRKGEATGAAQEKTDLLSESMRTNIRVLTGAFAGLIAILSGLTKVCSPKVASKIGVTVVSLGCCFILSLWMFLRVNHGDIFYPDAENHWSASGNILLAAVNPLALSPATYAGLLGPFVVSKLILDWSVEFALIRLPRTAFLPARDPADPGKKSLPVLVALDYIFLGANQLIEFAFTLHMFQFVMTSPAVVWELDAITMTNVFPALVLIFVIDDLLYAPSHRFMHWGPVYWIIHKHHHKQKYPIRGYADAANETPLEQLIGLSCVWITIQIVPVFTGLHVAAVGIFFVLYAATAILNHTAHDVKLWLGFGYSVRTHEMHHRLSNCNYGQNFMVWDYIMGTYKEYKA